MMQLKALLREQLGSELLEVALLLPVFLMLLFGIIGFGIVMFGWCNITFAAREAARYASVHSSASLNPATTASITAVVTPYLVAVPAAGSTTTVTYSSANTIGATVSVKVDARYPVTMPFTSYTSFAVSTTTQRTITR